MKHAEVRERNKEFLAQRQRGLKLREISELYNTPINTVLWGIRQAEKYGSY